MRLAATIITVPSYIRKNIASAILIAPAAIAASGGILPFSFRWKTKVLSRQIIQARDKSLTIIPTHLLHGQIIALEIRRVIPHHYTPKRLRDLVFTKIKTAEGYAVRRLFITLCGDKCTNGC